MNELTHWGIKGMRWGIRRYQNKDGSLTEAGRKRYGTDYDPHKMADRLSTYMTSNTFKNSNTYKKVENEHAKEMAKLNNNSKYKWYLQKNKEIDKRMDEGDDNAPFKNEKEFDKYLDLEEQYSADYTKAMNRIDKKASAMLLRDLNYEYSDEGRDIVNELLARLRY